MFEMRDSPNSEMMEDVPSKLHCLLLLRRSKSTGSASELDALLCSPSVWTWSNLILNWFCQNLAGLYLGATRQIKPKCHTFFYRHLQPSNHWHCPSGAFQLRYNVAVVYLRHSDVSAAEISQGSASALLISSPNCSFYKRGTLQACPACCIKGFHNHPDIILFRILWWYWCEAAALFEIGLLFLFFMRFISHPSFCPPQISE